MLNSRFGNCTEEVKKQLFLAYCESFYCAAIWNNYTDAVLTKLHVIHTIYSGCYYPPGVQHTISLLEIVPSF